ncbi:MULTISPECIES: cell wall-binding repeat-containing protein [Clostridium]|uniref:Cell wall-binding repeat-containing protein n=1 Tax=Clostridium faecium TaxID=2762223 RepID=A0ABR8YSU2_9CLOT|nr:MULTISPECIES: cell wall-binding repeat-containing protein [Clostridium]MBD8047269.1 cell wall-binding repeat-containing protein [Clostridium faecium]MDU1347972.1 cell wall-binding repeat-containing protein [Clostridium argentinense]
MKKSVFKIFICGLLAALLFNSTIVFAEGTEDTQSVKAMLQNEARSSKEDEIYFSGKWLEPKEETIVKRLYGGNNTGRYETAVAISKEKWKDGSDTVVIATGKDYPDALSATPLAAKYGAPILLTESGKLPQSVKNEITRLGASNVIIVGGNGVVSKDIEKELTSMGIETKRIDGKDRYVTAINIAKEVGTENGIAVAYGLNYTDALSMAPVAGKLSMPILLTPSNYMNSDVKNFIDSSEISNTAIIGGTGVISDKVASLFPNPIRIGGKNRFETNMNILTTFADGLSYDELYVATGMNYPDALAGSAAAATTGSPLVLVDKESVNFNTIVYTNLLRSKKVYGLGGQAIVNDEILLYIKELVQYFDIVNIKSKPITINRNEFAMLPHAICVLQDGMTMNDILPKIVEVEWQTEDEVIDTSVAGEKTYIGVIKGKNINDSQYKLELKVIIK